MRARKKPVEVDVLQIATDMPIRDVDHFMRGSECKATIGPDGLTITTYVQGRYEETTECAWGNWLIKGVKGEVYPCRDEVFRETYDILPEPKPEGPKA